MSMNDALWVRVCSSGQPRVIVRRVSVVCESWGRSIAMLSTTMEASHELDASSDTALSMRRMRNGSSSDVSTS